MTYSGKSWGNQSWDNQSWSNQSWDTQNWGKSFDKGFGKGSNSKGSKGFGKGFGKNFGKSSKGSKGLIRQCTNGPQCSHLRENTPCTYGHELSECKAGVQARIALLQQQLAFWTDAETRLSKAGEFVSGGGLFVLSKVYEESGGVLRVNTPPGYNENDESEESGETDNGSWDTQTDSQPDAVQPDAVQPDDGGCASEPVDG